MIKMFTLIIFLGTFNSSLYASSANANDLNCTIKHVSAESDGDIILDADINGALKVKNVDLQKSAYPIEVKANGKTRKLDLNPVPLKAGEAYSYSSQQTQTSNGIKVILSFTLKVLTDKTFVLEGGTDGSSDFPSASETDTGVCN